MKSCRLDSRRFGLLQSLIEKYTGFNILLLSVFARVLSYNYISEQNKLNWTDVLDQKLMLKPIITCIFLGMFWQRLKCFPLSWQ